MNQELLPKLDMDKLQEKTNESAMNGAIATIKDYYEGWNSPFRKAIEEDLKTKQVSYPLQLPDIIAKINDGLVNQIDAIANEAVAKSFIPLVNRFLTREPKEILFSELLKSFIAETDEEDQEEYSIDIKDCRPNYTWFDVTLTCGTDEYKLVMYLEKRYGKNEPVPEQERCYILSLPDKYDDRKKMMKIKKDDVTLELPFTSDVLSNGFVSYIARLIIGKSVIIMDTHDFSDEMFEEKCHC